MSAPCRPPWPTRIGHWAAWIVLAASLIELRSRLLLPAPRAAQAEAEARRDLVSRAALAAAVDWLECRPELGRTVFARVREVPMSERVGDITDLLRACLLALRVPEEQATTRLRPPPFWRVSDALARLEKLLQMRPEGPLKTFLPAIGRDEPERELRCRAAVASTLIASLELARTGRVTLDQMAPWTPIHIQGRQAADVPASPTR